MEHTKVKSATKRVRTRGEELDKLVLRTMRLCSDIVGDTLGPGGRPVLIERQDHGMPPIVTKDGVTVFRALGMQGDEHVVMEAARDCSVRTAMAAGDGTTTATILAEAIVSRTSKYCKANRKISPQRAVETLRKCWSEILEPKLKELSVQLTLEGERNRKYLRAVAKISGNGDSELADAVMQCYDECGDEGNVTIMESAGHDSRYVVERIDGYPIHLGYDKCCGPFAAEFINDQGAQKCWMPQPAFVCYNGKLHDMQAIFPLLKKVGEAWIEHSFNHNVVVVAHDFSENVLAHFALNFKSPNGLKIYPLRTPLTPSISGQVDFLHDLAAVADCEIFDPLTKPLEQGELVDLGPYFEDEDGSCSIRGIEAFEATRHQSNVLGHADEERVLKRIEELRVQAANPASELDGLLLRERMAKLTGGIAKLKVVGSSDGETKERRDRADDAVCAVRGALKSGCLPGGGWALLALQREVLNSIRNELGYENSVLYQVLVGALEEPCHRLLANAGLNDEEIVDIVDFMKHKLANPGEYVAVYDAAEHKMVDAFEAGVLDSAPAVTEALKNALSIASILGTLGGMVTFVRDAELDRSEAKANEAWLRDANINPADERP